ncbi:glutamate-5-semialdehyde dehydrogenase [Gallicola sp. Sow4_E12]|uniref:glutamate-5-semialdehyde dehydrogenase n=1 Tax=Gallicola sp. Sow4_E12 TaxID=3438785 RepID=UPI003F928DEC
MLKHIGEKAKEASYELLEKTTLEKNEILQEISNQLSEFSNEIIEANQIDMKNGRKNGLTEGLLDRLLITEDRIKSMQESVKVVYDLEDPIGKMDYMKTLANGLKIGQTSVPIGVVAIIYEARPNVTLDCSILCLKSSNSLILRGGKEAIETNKKIVEAVQKAFKNCGTDPNCVQLIEDTTRESAQELMKLNGYVDVLIPRGSRGLIQSVVQNATVPVIETGEGNCHIYVDESADIDMTLKIIENAKTQRIGVCNAMESILVHETVGDSFYKGLEKIINEYKIDVHACEKSIGKIKNASAATEEDFYKEYLDYAFSIKVVDSVDTAIKHIEKYGTHHSDVIITNDYNNSLAFTQRVNSACVYVNASSRFTDGSEFGMGAEMGISTQKLHVRGPVGLKGLTSSKYIILGQGQIR